MLLPRRLRSRPKKEYTCVNNEATPFERQVATPNQTSSLSSLSHPLPLLQFPPNLPGPQPSSLLPQPFLISPNLYHEFILSVSGCFISAEASLATAASFLNFHLRTTANSICQAQAPPRPQHLEKISPPLDYRHYATPRLCYLTP